MDIWNRLMAEKFRIIFKVCIRTNKGGVRVQPNMDRCGQRGSKITENVRTSFISRKNQRF